MNFHWVNYCRVTFDYSQLDSFSSNNCLIVLCKWNAWRIYSVHDAFSSNLFLVLGSKNKKEIKISFTKINSQNIKFILNLIKTQSQFAILMWNEQKNTRRTYYHSLQESIKKMELTYWAWNISNPPASLLTTCQFVIPHYSHWRQELSFCLSSSPLAAILSYLNR